MRMVILGLLSIVIALANTSIPFFTGSPWLRPDLPLVLVLAWGLAFGGAQGVLAAGVNGLLLDSLSAVPVGTHVLALVPAALLASARGTDLFASRASLPFVLVPLATLGFYGVLALVFGMQGRPLDLTGGLLWVAGALVLNAAVSPVLFVVTSLLALRYSEQFRTIARV